MKFIVTIVYTIQHLNYIIFLSILYILYYEMIKMILCISRCLLMYLNIYEMKVKVKNVLCIFCFTKI